MLAPVLITPPVNRPLTLVEAKEALRVDHSDDDALIDGCIDAAISHLDGYKGVLGQALLIQTWRQDFGCFASKMRLPFGPANEICEIVYFDGSNVAQRLSPSVYCLLTDARGPYLRLQYGQSWPGTVAREDAISVTFKVGRNDDDLEQSLRSALLLLVGHFYECREATSKTAMSEIPFGVQALIAPHRRVGI